MRPHGPAARNIRLLYAFWFLRDFHLWIPVWIVYLTLDQGFSLTQITSAEGLFLVGVVALEVPTGAVADRWGRSRSLALGAAVLSISVFVFAFTTSFAILMTSFMLWSVASTLMSGADNALLFDSLKADGRESEYERIAGRGASGAWIAFGLATLFAGPVAELISIKTIIIIGAGTALGSSAIALAMREPQRTADAPSHTVGASVRSAFGHVWRSPELRAGMLLTGVGIAGLESVHYVTQPYLLDRGVEVGTYFSLLQVPMVLAGIFGALVAARLAGRGSAKAAMLVLPLGGVAAYAALALSPGLTAYAAFPLLYGLGSCLMPISSGYVNRRVGSDQRATVLSIQSMVSGLVMAAFAPMLGFAVDTWGLAQAFALGGALTVVGLVLFGPPLLLQRGRARRGARRRPGS